jgi:amino acid adenylation domain-containing protein
VSAPGNLADVYPLTPMQQGMFFHSLQAPKSVGMYVQQMEVRFRGELDAAKLRGAWERVLGRHAALRTMFVWDEKKPPVQAVCRSLPLPWKEEDWRGLGDAEARLERFLREDRAVGFDLKSAPLMRCALIRTDSEYVLVWTFHHLLIDGWCLSAVLGEVLEFYFAACEGRAIELPAPPPFRDYVVWLKRQNEAAALAFWTGELKGFSGMPRLGHEAAAGVEEEYAEQELLLSEEATAALEKMARRERVTLSACLQTAWALLLARYGDTDDVVFGATHAGRPASLAGSGRMIGVFLSTVPVRVRVDADTTLRELLRRLFDGQPARDENAWAPLASIQRASDLPGGAQLFESIVVFENYPVSRPGVRAGLEVGSVRGYDRTNYPLTLLAMPGARLTLRLAYQTNRFASDEIARMLGHLEALLERLPEQAGESVGSLSMTTARELAAISAWNAIARPYRTGITLVDLMEEQAERTPDAVAVSFEGASLTYRELHRRADALAERLAARGAGPETVVAVELERSLELIVALVGVLKAGAAYLPIDPSHPAERRAEMARDAGAMLLEGGDGSLAQRRRAAPENLAYVIYTSGSTGRPKGVMNAHEGIVNRLLWMQEAFGLGTGDVVLQKTPATFDVSVWEFFWPLITGARLAVAPPDAHKDPDALAGIIAREQVTTIHFVPSMLRTFVSYATGELPSLRRVICSGEALPSELVRQFQARFGADLHNLYGPTEAAVDVTHHACAAGEERTPIGHAIANTQAWVLDAWLRPVPVGIAGELYLGGVQVARGYRGRPGLTAERFVPDPFHTGARLYRTGDRAVLLANGEIEYLGRSDFQVKIRGFRVEPGEIEQHLERHPHVGQAVVASYEAAEGNRLAAYLTPRNGVRPEASDLRAFLRQALPEYMVPSAFVVLDSLPLTSSGKVNRKALPALDAKPVAEPVLVEPRSAVEREIAAIWEEALQRKGIGIRDNFFDLGGNSLLLVPVHRKLATRLNATLSVPDLFRFPTIESLSARLSETAVKAPVSAAPRALNSLAAQRAARQQAREIARGAGQLG